MRTGAFEGMRGRVATMEGKRGLEGCAMVGCGPHSGAVRYAWESSERGMVG